MYDRSERAANGPGVSAMRDYPEDKFPPVSTKLGRSDDRIRTEDVVTSLQNLHALIREVHGSACGYGPEIASPVSDRPEPNGRFEMIEQMNQYCLRMISECTGWVNDINHKAP